MLKQHVKVRLARWSTRYVWALARLVVRRRRPVIVAITGSAGKTTTKEIVGAALRHEAVRPHLGLVWKTGGNLNDVRGLPQTLLGYTSWAGSPWRRRRRLMAMPFRALRLITVGPYPRYMVLEYGLGKQTKIRRLAELAPPTVAIVTAVGPAHMDSYPTVAAVAAEKGTLVAALPPTGLAILGADNEHAAAMDRLTRAPVRKVPGRGREFAQAAARAVGDYLGVPADAMERALAADVPLRGRQELVDLGAVRLVSDAFNANPLSMRYGLEQFAAMARPGERRVAILGGMGELAGHSLPCHLDIAAAARPLADVVVGVGELARQYGFDHWYASSAECAAAIPSLLRAGDLVFVKGSASVKLRPVVDAVRRAGAALKPAGAPAA